MKTFTKKNMAACNAEIVYKPFYEGKDSHKNFYKGKWPHAARKCFMKHFLKGHEIINQYKDFYKGNLPRAARNFFEIVVH